VLAALGQAHATRQVWRRASSGTRCSRAAPENTSHGASHAGGEPQFRKHPAPLRAPAARAAPPGHTLQKARSTCARCSAAAVAPRYCQSPSGHAAAHPSTRATPSAPHTACAKPARCAGGGGGRKHPGASRAPRGSRLWLGCAAPWRRAAGRRCAPCRGRCQRLHPRPRRRPQTPWRAPSPLRQLERPPRAAWTLSPPADQRWARQAAGPPQAERQQLQAQPAGSGRAPRPAGLCRPPSSPALPLRPGLQRLLRTGHPVSPHREGRTLATASRRVHPPRLCKPAVAVADILLPPELALPGPTSNNPGASTFSRTRNPEWPGVSGSGTLTRPRGRSSLPKKGWASQAGTHAGR